MSNFLELVAKERARQINDEGYKREHDDEHTDGSLADAAACYAANHQYIWKQAPEVPDELWLLWPWDIDFLKKEKHPRKKQLIISAALLMAEYDRLEREDKKQNQGNINEITQH